MKNKLVEIHAELLKTKSRWLVTGAAGFIGSNLTEFLLSSNQVVVGLDNFLTGRRENIEAIRSNLTPDQQKNFRFVEGDITDLETCKKSCMQIDYVLHQAALGSVPRSIETPYLTNECNVTGFVNMLFAAKDAKVKNFVYASSSSVYGDDENLPKIEDRTGNLLSPYAATKKINEIYSQVFNLNYSLNSIGLRYFNVFGRRQDPNGPYAAVIPRWVANILEGKDSVIFGDGETSRDFCYIDNVVQINILAALSTNKLALNQVYNVALNSKTSLNELYEFMCKGLKERSPNLEIKKPKYENFRPGDIRHSQANIDKAQQLLGYQPTHNISDGLNECLDWYVKNHLEGQT